MLFKHSKGVAQYETSHTFLQILKSEDGAVNKVGQGLHYFRDQTINYLKICIEKDSFIRNIFKISVLLKATVLKSLWETVYIEIQVCVFVT